MNKSFLFLLIACSLSYLQANAQSYNKYIQQGKDFYNKSEYLTALERFDLADEFAKSEADKNDAKSWKNKSREKIKAQQNDLKKSLALVKVEKARSDSLLNVSKAALEKADQMQRKVETAVFDKAVKNRFKEWKGFEKYLYNDKSINDEGKQILEKIDSLDLSENALLRIPSEVLQCPNLKHINLFYNPDISWQASIETINRLNPYTDLYISDYDLNSLPSPYLKYIKGIKVLQNRLAVIPTNILAQKQLNYLDISADMGSTNLFTNLPSEIFELINLQYLNLKYGRIQNVDSKISNLGNLLILDLGDNELSSLPTEICKLGDLSSLNLKFNQLNALPPEIGKLISLTNLDLSRNRLNKLPAGIGNLTKLSELDLSNNKLQSLPKEIGQLTNLSALNAGNNELQNLPMEIKNLANLKKLDLRYNQLTNLPVELGELANLTILDLSNNEKLKLLDICNSFTTYKRNIQIHSNEYDGYLSRHFVIDPNEDFLLINIPKQTGLPSEIGKLTNLTALVLNDNDLESIPAEIGKLINLRTLYLWDNQLQELPVEIGMLSKLKSLSLRYNQLTVLPAKFRELTNLTLLDIAGNKLKDFPIEIVKLTNLNSLNLSDNQLQELPKEIGKLSNLKTLHVSGNPLKSVPDELFLLNLDAISYIEIGITLANNKNYKQAYKSTLRCTQLYSKNYSAWYNLSFYSLFVKEYNQAITSAFKSLELNPEANGVYSNLVLGYLLSNQWSKAEPIYKEWKDKHFNNEVRLCKEVFLLDIKDLEKAGITHPDFEKVSMLLAE